MGSPAGDAVAGAAVAEVEEGVRAVLAGGGNCVVVVVELVVTDALPLLDVEALLLTVVAGVERG